MFYVYIFPRQLTVAGEWMIRVPVECHFIQVISSPRSQGDSASIDFSKSDASHMITMWIISLLTHDANGAVYLTQINSKFRICSHELICFY